MPKVYGGHIPGADSAQEGGNDPQTVWPTWLRLPTKHVPGVVPGVAIFKAIAQAPRYTQYRWLKTHKKHKHHAAVPLPKQPPQEWPENQSPGGASVSVLKGETIANCSRSASPGGAGQPSSCALRAEELFKLLANETAVSSEAEE